MVSVLTSTILEVIVELMVIVLVTVNMMVLTGTVV